MKIKIIGFFIITILILSSIVSLAYTLKQNNNRESTTTNLLEQKICSGDFLQPPWFELMKLLPSDGASEDWFGHSVSLDGDTALIGASTDDDNGDRSGSAYVFVRSGSTWIQQAKILPSDGAENDRFGCSVSLDGDAALIGAVNDDDNGWNSGSAYVFIRSGTSWSQQAKLLPLDGEDDDGFGGVSLDGDTALIGASTDDDNGWNSGSAYVFVRSGTSWSQQAKLLPSDGAENHFFGGSVSLDGDTALIGADRGNGNEEDCGSAYVFTRSGTTWTQQHKITASDGSTLDTFGFSVSLDGDTALIGARQDNENGELSGSAYIFTRSGTSWYQQAKLYSSDGVESDLFGYSVSLDGDTALIGTIRGDGNEEDSGTGYIFTRSGLTWTEQAKLIASEGINNDGFSCSVSLDGDTALIGAMRDDDNGENSGSAYIFTKENQPPYIPGNPNPANNALDIDINADLGWTGGDPNSGDILTYDVYFGTNTNPPLHKTDHTTTIYDPGIMSYNTVYYWKIVAKDNHGANTTGLIWHFTTIKASNNPPNKPSAIYKRDTDELVISATDPDNDQLRYGVSWDNDNVVDQWTIFVGSGTEQKIDCNGRRGTVGIIAEDEFGAQSDWDSVKFKYKPTTNWFDRFIYYLPFFEKILNQII